MTVRETIRTKSGGQQIIMTPFPDYCEHLKVDLFKLLGDFEGVCETMTGSHREDWLEEEVEAFDRVRSRILDVAGSIAR